MSWEESFSPFARCVTNWLDIQKQFSLSKIFFDVMVATRPIHKWLVPAEIKGRTQLPQVKMEASRPSHHGHIFCWTKGFVRGKKTRLNAFPMLKL